MKQFPPASELSFLLDSELNFIRVARYSYHFSFLPNANLHVESEIRYVELDGTIYRYDVQSKVTEVLFTRLIGEKVARLAGC
jgi:hypothetical protein